MPSYSFNPKNRTYYDGKRSIPRSQIRDWIQSANEAQRKRLENIGSAFTSGRINRSEAELRAIAEITKHNSAIAVIANGGREQMTAKAWGRAAGPVKSERGFLRELFLSLDRGDVTKDNLERRLGNYANAGTRTYENLSRQYAKDGGFDEERRILGGGNHCSACPGLAAHWEKIGTLPEIGDTPCGPGCNCRFELRGEGGMLLPADALETESGLMRSDEFAEADRVRTDLLAIREALDAEFESFGLTSRWDGTVSVRAGFDAAGEKKFSCSIVIDKDHAAVAGIREHVMTHEAIHAYSSGGSSARAYLNNTGWEEGVVEGYARLARQKVWKRLGYSDAEIADMQGKVAQSFDRTNGYNRYIKVIDKIQSTIGPELGLSREEFYRRMLTIPIGRRHTYVFETLVKDKRVSQKTRRLMKGLEFNSQKPLGTKL